MGFELVVFDCDGVLFDSDGANWAFYDEIMKRAGQPPLPETARPDASALASAQLFQRYYGDDPESLATIRATARATDYGPFFSLMKPRSDLRQVLEGLRGRYQTAMASNRSRTLGGVIEYFGLEGLFDLVVGVADVKHPKPAPDMLLECNRRLGVDPGRAVYVGDQESDRLSAAAAGMVFVGIGAAVAAAEFRINTLEELEPLLASIDCA